MTKYRAKSITIDGFFFPSLKEGRRYMDLKILLRAGKISELVRQPVFEIVMNGIKCGEYWADFGYLENGQRKVEDVKGFKTDVYKLKKKLVEAQYGIQIIEV